MLRKNVLRYASTSANLYNFLGDTNFEKHIDIYKTIIDNALKAHQDIMSFAVEKAMIEDPFDTLSRMQEHPYVFVTFHTGSFNMPASLLLTRGHKVNILSDTESVVNSDYKQVTEVYNRHYKNDCSMNMVNVENEGAIFNILRQMKQGAVTFAYLDGNKGVGGQTKHNENMLDIAFLNGRVKIRKGVAFISYLMKAPIVVALSYNVGGVDYIKFHEPIFPGESNRELFCVKVMERIMEVFEGHVRKYYDQWSNWLYVHLWTDLDYFKQKLTHVDYTSTALPKEDLLTFNAQRFCPLRLDDKFYLFDRILYTAIPVDESFKNIFSHKTNDQERRFIINKMMVETPEKTTELIQKQVLIEV